MIIIIIKKRRTKHLYLFCTFLGQIVTLAAETNKTSLMALVHKMQPKPPQQQGPFAACEVNEML